MSSAESEDVDVDGSYDDARQVRREIGHRENRDSEIGHRAIGHHEMWDEVSSNSMFQN